MTRNEAFVREGVAAFNTGNLSAWLAFVDPHARFYTYGLLPDVDAVYEGHDGFGAFWDRWWEPWDQLQVEIEKIDDSGGVITVDLHWTGEGADGPPRRDAAGNGAHGPGRSLDLDGGRTARR
jgi:hypothetical protein